MKRAHLRIVAVALALAAAGSGRVAWLGAVPPAKPQAAAPTLRMYVCGGPVVHEMTTDGDGASRAWRVTWTWDPAKDAGVAASQVASFATTDECKATDDGGRLLVTSSSGGVAIVERTTGRATFVARVANAHSIEALPGARIVVAASTAPDGNQLEVFDVARPQRPLMVEPLVSAHGVVWDAARQRLWALGLDQLRVYRLRAWDTAHPRLERVATHLLPSVGGHDLSAVPGSAALVVTTESEVLEFDRETSRFTPYGDLAERHHIKSVHIHPQTRIVAFVQAQSRQVWWTDHVSFPDPTPAARLPGEQVYKARWRP